MAEGDPAKLDLLIQDRIADIQNSLTEYEATFARVLDVNCASTALRLYLSPNRLRAVMRQ
jgi:hypothetical protein